MLSLFTTSCERDDYLGGPQAVLFERHELDKANDHALFAREARKGDDLVVVEAAQQHTVHLDRTQPGTLGGAHPGQHLFEAARNTRDARKDCRVDGVHADRDPAKPGTRERSCHLGQKVSIGGDGKVQRSRRPELVRKLGKLCH